MLSILITLCLNKIPFLFFLFSLCCKFSPKIIFLSYSLACDLAKKEPRRLSSGKVFFSEFTLDSKFEWSRLLTFLITFGDLNIACVDFFFWVVL